MIKADTNIFIYAIDPKDTSKQRIARDVIRHLEKQASVIALQAVGEFQNAAARKLKLSKPVIARHAASVLNAFETFPASKSAAHAALAEMAAGRLNYWDALMLASAAEAGCTAMLTEDLQDGARLFGIEIVNPVGGGGLSRRAAELLASA